MPRFMVERTFPEAIRSPKSDPDLRSQTICTRLVFCEPRHAVRKTNLIRWGWPCAKMHRSNRSFRWSR